MVEAPFAPEFISLTADRRFSLPQAYCQKLSWIRGDENMRVWLLQLVPGRFRVLSDSEVDKHERLREIRSIIVNGPAEPGTAPTTFELSNVAALIGRLIPTMLSAPPPSWRLILPKQVLPEEKDKWSLVVIFSMGYLEIWRLDIYNAAAASPLDDLI